MGNGYVSNVTEDLHKCMANMTKALINKQIVDVKILKERKLFWLFEQVLVEYDIDIENNAYLPLKVFDIFNVVEWIPKSNLIEDYE